MFFEKSVIHWGSMSCSFIIPASSRIQFRISAFGFEFNSEFVFGVLHLWELSSARSELPRRRLDLLTACHQSRLLSSLQAQRTSTFVSRTRELPGFSRYVLGIICASERGILTKHHSLHSKMFCMQCNFRCIIRT